MSASIRLIGAPLLVAVLVAACSGGTSSGSSGTVSATSGPSLASAAPTPSGSTSGAFPSGECAPTGSACVTPAPSSVPTGGASASGAPLAGFACPPAATALSAPSNRLIDVAVTPKDGYDEVAFVFGPPGTGSSVDPRLTVAAAMPPFVAGASGAPLAVEGQTFVALKFRDMIVSDVAGRPTYAGSMEIRPPTSGVQDVVQSEAFEGVVGWIVGSRAPGCVRVRADAAGSRILLDVQRP